MSINAAQVKELRDKSGVGMMDCKKALQESDGDIDKAFDYLRKAGVAKALKKEGRTTKEGLVVSHIDSKSKIGVLLELNCETDFVANTDDFLKLGQDIALHIIESTESQLEYVLEENFIKDSSKMVKDVITDTVGRLGENIVISRFCRFELGFNNDKDNNLGEGFVVPYIHPGSKLGVLLELNCETRSSAICDEFLQLGKDIAMHVAATNPISVNSDDIDNEIINKEKEIYFEQAKSTNKPDNIIEKMVEGRIKKFYKENVLIEQDFVKDPNKTIKDIVTDTIGNLGENIVVSRFKRFQLGDNNN